MHQNAGNMSQNFLGKLNTLYNDNDNDNELFIQTKSNEKHHKGNINNTYKNINIATFVPRRLHLKTSWPLAYNHL